MTEEIRYIANLQRQEEFDNEVTELKDELKRLEQENKELKEVKEQLKKWNDENLKRQNDMQKWIDLAEEQRKNYRSALEEINATVKTMINGVTPADNVTAYLVALNAIETRINEVLGNENN